MSQGLRIDYVLCSQGLVPRVASCEILGQDVLPPKWSDHAGWRLFVFGLEEESVRGLALPSN